MSPHRRYGKWSETSMEDAIRAVNENGMSLRQDHPILNHYSVFLTNCCIFDTNEKTNQMQHRLESFQ